MIYSRPDTDFDAWLTDAPMGLVGTLTVRIEDADTGTVVVAETTAGISEPRTGYYKVTLTAPVTEADYFVIWANGSTEVKEELEVTSTAPSADAFAATADVAARLGVTFTSDQEAQATALLELIALEIADATGKDVGDIDATIPILKVVSVQACVRAIANATGAMVASETLGAYSHTDTYGPSGGAAVFLTPTERSRVRRAVLGGYLVAPRTPATDDSLYLPEVDDEALIEGWLGGTTDGFFLFS